MIVKLDRFLKNWQFPTNKYGEKELTTTVTKPIFVRGVLKPSDMIADICF